MSRQNKYNCKSFTLFCGVYAEGGHGEQKHVPEKLVHLHRDRVNAGISFHDFPPNSSFILSATIFNIHEKLYDVLIATLWTCALYYYMNALKG